MQQVINLRGIFKLPIIRNILDRLVYFEEQEQICYSMGPFQVGNQKKRNIRDNSLVLHAVVNEAIANKTAVDIQFTDIKQCFDSIWLEEATNDLFDSGVTTRNLNIWYEGNRKTEMCIETRVGRSDRVELNQIVMQGSVPGGFICSNQLSKLCNKLYKEGNVYMYRNKVPVPALAMVDDIASIAVCNSTEALTCNIKTDSFIQRKKLEGQVGDGKCQWVHAGPGTCRSTYYTDGKPISQAAAYKYLGDFVSNGWKALYTKRWEKAQGYSATCQAMCSEMSLGFQVYQIAKLLHLSIFVNGTLLNTETWPNFTEERIKALERTEQTFFRKILQAHSKTPIEAIYLELGVIPLRFHLMKRRIMYYVEVMGRNDNEITKQVVLAQMECCYEGDFYAQVEQDIDVLQLSNSDLVQEKETLRKHLSKIVEQYAFQELMRKATTHSKVHHEIYRNIDGAPHYNNPLFTPDLVNLLFKFRTRTYMVKNNFRNNYRNTNTLCPLCQEQEDSQGHLFECRKIKDLYHKQVQCSIDDIYSSDEDVLYQTACTLKELVTIRDLILNNDSSESKKSSNKSEALQESGKE